MTPQSKNNTQLLEHATIMATILGVLSNPIRLLIVCFLLDGEKCGLDILDFIGTTKGNISSHLKLILAHKLIKSRKVGNRVYYSIHDEKLRKLLKVMKSQYCPELY